MINKYKTITDFILKRSLADQTEVVLISSDFSLSRFANNQIHQNIRRRDDQVSIRLVLGKKIVVVRTNNLGKNNLVNTLEKGWKLIKKQKEDPDFISLPTVAKYRPVEAYFAKTALFSARKRAQKVAETIKKAKSAKLTCFGALSNGVTEFIVANSQGILADFPNTDASFSTIMMAKTSSGYGSSLSLDIDKLGIEKETDRAIKTALMGKRPRLVKAGSYEVVLAPEAVNELLIYLAYLGFGARAYYEKRSFLSGKLGKKVMGSNITIWDDAYDPLGLPMPFDLEGVPKRKVILIDKGIAKNIVYDSYLAGKYGKRSTGHGLPAPNTLDALATHLHLQPAVKVSAKQENAHIGQDSPFSADEQRLIKHVKKGLFISRFHYVNAHHHNLQITGLTRDGTFMIENGEISYPVVNLRFTQSIPEALNRVVEIGSETKVMASWLGANLAPALRIDQFNFTGVSKEKS